MELLIKIRNAPMKLIDGLLKKLNVSRNTFFTFILTFFCRYVNIFAIEQKNKPHV